MKKNEIYTAEIVDYTTEGSGICRIDGMAVFVPDAAVGDSADIRILKAAKKYAFGKKYEKIAQNSIFALDNLEIKISECRVTPTLDSTHYALADFLLFYQYLFQSGFRYLVRASR